MERRFKFPSVGGLVVEDSCCSYSTSACHCCCVTTLRWQNKSPGDCWPEVVACIELQLDPLMLLFFQVWLQEVDRPSNGFRSVARKRRFQPGSHRRATNFLTHCCDQHDVIAGRPLESESARLIVQFSIDLFSYLFIYVFYFSGGTGRVSESLQSAPQMNRAEEKSPYGKKLSRKFESSLLLPLPLLLLLPHLPSRPSSSAPQFLILLGGRDLRQAATASGAL